MRVSENILKWAMRLYFPLFFQRIWTKKIYKGFTKADVKINKSLATINFGNAIFGGTIYSATDPIFAMLLGQIIRHKGYKISVWLKTASIKYVKPGVEDLYFTIDVTDEMVEQVQHELDEKGVSVCSTTIYIYNKKRILHAIAKNTICIKKK
jgi:3-isopropylmalate dehydratase small subunit